VPRFGGGDDGNLQETTMASMRSLQNLDINLGLFGFPVKVYKAINDPAEGVSFRQVHGACGTPINLVKRCQTCAADVQQAELVKGYEVAPGNFLTFTEDELKALRPDRLGVVQVDGYVGEDAVGDSYYDGSVYYLSPGGKDSTTFVTFRDALADRMAVGKVVMYGRERVVVIRSTGKLLAMHFLRNHADIRTISDVPQYAAVPEQANAQHLALMAQLMDAKRVSFDDVVLESDSYAEAVKALIQSRVDGAPAPVPAAVVPQAATVDLMAMLNASLAAAKAA
jgi:DNA end-binding protein Ku